MAHLTAVNKRLAVVGPNNDRMFDPAFSFFEPKEAGYTWKHPFEEGRPTEPLATLSIAMKK